MFVFINNFRKDRSTYSVQKIVAFCFVVLFSVFVLFLYLWCKVGWIYGWGTGIYGDLTIHTYTTKLWLKSRAFSETPDISNLTWLKRIPIFTHKRLWWSQMTWISTYVSKRDWDWTDSAHTCPCCYYYIRTTGSTVNADLFPFLTTWEKHVSRVTLF